MGRSETGVKGGRLRTGASEVIWLGEVGGGGIAGLFASSSFVYAMGFGH